MVLTVTAVTVSLGMMETDVRLTSMTVPAVLYVKMEELAGYIYICKKMFSACS